MIMLIWFDLWIIRRVFQPVADSLRNNTPINCFHVSQFLFTGAIFATIFHVLYRIVYGNIFDKIFYPLFAFVFIPKFYQAIKLAQKRAENNAQESQGDAIKLDSGDYLYINYFERLFWLFLTIMDVDRMIMHASIVEALNHMLFPIAAPAAYFLACHVGPKQRRKVKAVSFDNMLAVKT